MSTHAIMFDQVISRGCGIDVHKENVVVTIRGDGIKEECRTFQTFTSDLLSCNDWLMEQKITHIAMESTGVYWKPVFNIPEKDFNIILVNARHIKNVPGHKTDRKDSAWITKLLFSGLLKGSFYLLRPYGIYASYTGIKGNWCSRESVNEIAFRKYWKTRILNWRLS